MLMGESKRLRQCATSCFYSPLGRLQYREAKLLLADVNKNRPRKEPYYRHCLNTTGSACFAPIRLLDRLRISRFVRFLVKKGLVHDRSLSDCNEEQAFAKDRYLRREARIKAQVEDANMTWTMSMAFYALSGGCIYTSKTGEQRVLRRDAIAYLAAHEPHSLLQLQRVVLQNPGKANAIGKTITCVQALWFCAQCLARLSGNLAVSLLELNTFAHCISTLLIYIFWWDKPYDVEAHTFITSKSLDFCFLLHLSGVNNPWSVPVISMPYRPDQTLQDAVIHTIFDSNGNRLVCDTVRVFLVLEASASHPSGVLFQMGSKVRMHDTGLFISFESSIIMSAPTYLHSNYEKWKSLWSTWVESGRPLPPEPIIQTERWFYRRTAGSPDLDADIVDQINYQVSPTISLIMTLTFIVYGGLHLLAWHYNFKSESERYLWRISAVTTASTGLLLLALYLFDVSDRKAFNLGLGDEALSGNTKAEARFYGCAFNGLRWSLYLLAMFNVAARAFLIIESFIALPNSPPSTYTIPTWTAYIPHI